MQFYNEKNIKYFYLSPYVEFKFNNKGVFFINTLFDCCFQLNVNQKKAFKLIDRLNKGVTYWQGVFAVLFYCNTLKAKDLFIELVNRGIVE